MDKKVKKVKKDSDEPAAPAAESSEIDSLMDLKAIIASIKKDTDGEPAVKEEKTEERPTDRDEEHPADKKTEPVEEKPDDRKSDEVPSPPIPDHPRSSLSDEDILQLKKIMQDISEQKEQMAKKDADLREKEEAIRRGTQLLLEQRDALVKKEEGLKTRETDLRGIAGELEKQAKRLAERETLITQGQMKLAEEDSRRKSRHDEFENKESGFLKKDARLRNLEKDLRVREQHILGIEMEIKECPYCNVKYEFEGIRDLIEEVRGYGLEVRELETKYTEAQNHLKKESYDMALDTARGILRDIKELRTDVLIKGLRYMFASTATTLDSAKDMGIDIRDAENMLREARKAMEKKDYRTAEYYAKEAEYLARDQMKAKALQAEAASEKPAVETYQMPAAAVPEENTTPIEDHQQPVYQSFDYQAPAVDTEPKKYNCTSCYAAFTIGSGHRPVKVSCPSCGNMMIIRD